jgi:hypothetical protein
MRFGWLLAAGVLAAGSVSPSSPLFAKQETIGTWQGMLPCPDCRAVRLRVTLKCDEGAEPRKCNYSLVESFLGTRDGEITNPVSGEWVLEKGTPADPEALVYRLDPQKPERLRLLLRVGDDLRMLDRRKGDLEPKDKYILRKVK